MTKKNKQIYINRLKSFAWRTLGLAIVFVCGFIVTAGSIYSVDWVTLSDALTLMVLGTIINEVTKYLNTGE
jgi:prepilin signal peptidase PulO-like enzyme (type II secretory pathway)